MNQFNSIFVKQLIRTMGSCLVILLITSIFCSKPPTEPSGPQTGTVTDFDGNVYKTVKIGNQWWMAENLKVTHYRNGSAIPNITDSTSWANLTTGAYCNYNNDTAQVAVYGRLYNLHAVNNFQNIAPEGWHVPSLTDWQTLVDYLGGTEAALNKMIEAGTDHWREDFGATNSSGFTALPAGARDWDGPLNFSSIGLTTRIWTSRSLDEDLSFYVGLCNFADEVSIESPGCISDGYSIRCVKNGSIPVVTTGLVTNETRTSAECSGTLWETGDSPIIDRGFCWSEDRQFPTITDSKIVVDSELDFFTGRITGLMGSCYYYVRAYATNDAGTGYGDVSTFRTFQLGLPVLSTAAISIITQNTAVCGGNITNDGGAPIERRGVCWSISPNPTVLADTTIDGIGTGQFTSQITGLTPNTRYYVRAYAWNNNGHGSSLGYGEERFFITDAGR